MKTKLFKIIFFLIIINTLFVSSAFAQRLFVSPDKLDFGTYGNDLAATLTCSWTGYDIEWVIDSQPTWTDVSPNKGTFSTYQDVEVSVDRSGSTLIPGQTYTGTITFSIVGIVPSSAAPATFSTPANLEVSMRVPLPPVLSVSPGSYNFGESGTSCQFSVQNTGESTLNWNASEGISWLSLSSSGGSLGQGALQFVTATVNRGTLSPGTYTGTISFTSNGGNRNVSVSMTVPEPDPQLSVNPTTYDFGTSETSHQFTVTNTGGGTLNWSVNEGIPWLSLNKFGGSLSAGSSENVTVTVDRAGVPPDSYSGTISFTSSYGNQNVTVWMTVPEPDPQLSVNPTSHDFGTGGISYQFTVTNTGGGTLDWSVSEGIPWLSLDKYSGSLFGGNSENVTATVDRTGITPGSYSDTISFTSNYGNQDVAVSMSVPDTTPPTGTILINNDVVYTNSTSVTLTLSASDSGSGVSKMKFSNEVAVWSDEEDYATSKSWTLTAGDGLKTVYVQYKDNAGNWSTPPLSISDTIILDTTPPSGTVLINSGDVYTDSTSVTLTLSASDSSGVDKMKFSNDGVVWSDEEDYAASKFWTLTAGDGLKTVYVQYKDNAGNWSGLTSISDTIILDTTPPSGTILINNGDVYTDSISVTLTLSASDSGSGVSKMKFSNNGVVWSDEEDYATSKSWTLTAGDGPKTIYVQYKDNADNWSTPPLSINDTIVLDTTPPSGTILINSGDEYTDSTTVALTLSASDSGSDVSKMKFSNDGVVWSVEEDYAVSKSWTLAAGDGPKIVYVQYKDNAGKWSGLTSISDTIILDTASPTGTILINSGDEYTDSPSVTLTLSASDSGSDVSKMKFSNEGAVWSSEEDYAASKSWTLTAGDGPKIVYVQYKDSSGKWSIPPLSISDTIILDTALPTGTILINSGDVYTDSPLVILTLSASDSGSGISKMKFSNNGVVWSSEEDYVTSKSWTLAAGDGLKIVYVQYKDNAGEWSIPPLSISDTIILDTTPPSGTILINSGDVYTDSSSVTLTLSANDAGGSGVSKMQFSNNGVVWSDEEDYATSKSWTLAPGDGTRAVYVQYKDNAGKWSGFTSISDTIILDTTPPTGTILINSGDVYTDSSSVTLTLSANDVGGSGVSTMRFSDDGASWSSEEDYATSKSWTLPGSDGPKIVYVQYKDNAGNWSSSDDAINDTIILDTAPPTGTILINGGAEYTDSTSVILTLSADDSSGVIRMKFSNDGVNWSIEEDYTTSKSTTVTTGDGPKTVYVQYKDNSGKWSGLTSISDTIILDTIDPTGTISIDGGEYTSTRSITLTLSASDSSGIATMRFSNDGVNWSDEEDYAISKSTTLPTGDGLKIVYVQYKDNSGKWSVAISDTIILDTTLPTGTILINNGDDYTNSISVTLTLEASDAGSTGSSGIATMKFSNDGVNWSIEEDYTTSKSTTVTTGDGPKTVYVQYKDNSGRWSVLISDTIILDRTPPTVTLKVDVDEEKILPDREIVGVLPNALMEAQFSKVMDTESVKRGLELRAIKNNLNETINEEVSLDFNWDSSTKTVSLTLRVGEELKKNHLYRLQVTDDAKDLAGNNAEGDKEVIFRTIMDHEKKNVVAKVTEEEITNLEVHLEANALTEDGYLIINPQPLTYQFDVKPDDINLANEKSIANGWYPVEGCLWEIKACKENGEWMEDTFGSEVKITFPYEEDKDKKGVVKNVREETLLAFWLDEKHSNWVRVPGSRVDKSTNVVITGEIPHFSVYGLMGTAVYDLSDAHAYPVPWKPNDGKDETGTEQQGITFTDLSAEGVVKIYTISGELVREYDYKPADTGKWTWDVETSNGEKVFSGVYIYYIKNERENKTGRLMIIR